MWRQITVGWCWPLRYKLRSLTPQRREDRGVSRGSLLSNWQQAWPSTRVLSQQRLSSVRPPSTSSSTASWMPVCMAVVGQTSPSHRAKGAMQLLPAGPALHGRAPLSKQTVQWDTSHGQHGTCHYQPCMAGSLPETQARPRAWMCTALESSKISQPGFVIRESPFTIMLDHQNFKVCGHFPLTNHFLLICQHNKQ